MASKVIVALMVSCLIAGALAGSAKVHKKRHHGHKRLFSEAVDLFQNIGKNIGDSVSQLNTDVKEVIESIKSDSSSILIKPGLEIIDNIVDALNETVTEQVQDVVDEVSKDQEEGTEVPAEVANTLESLMKTMTSMMESAVSQINSLIKFASSKIAPMLNNLLEIFQTAINNFGQITVQIGEALKKVDL